MAEQRTCNAKVEGSTPSSGTVPTALVVPIPSGNFERNYGVYSVRHESAERVTIRITKANRDLVQQTAKVLGMTESQFVRDASTNMAKAMLKHMEEHNAHASDRSG